MNEIIDIKDVSEEQLKQVLQDVFEGRSTLQEVHGFSDQHMEAIYTVAFNLYQSDKFEEAIPVFSWLCMLNPFKAKYWMGLGAALQMSRQFTKALEVYGLATLMGEPRDPTPYLRVGEVCLGMGLTEDALRAFATVLEFSQDSPQHAALLERANALINLLTEKAA